MGTIYVEVPVETSDVLEDLSDVELIRELRDRNIMAYAKEDISDLMEEIKSTFKEQDAMHFGILLGRLEAAVKS